jgi:hypothetical protein
MKEIKAPREVESSLERTHLSKTHEIFFFPYWFWIQSGSGSRPTILYCSFLVLYTQPSTPPLPVSRSLHCKKRLPVSFFLSPAGMSLTKLSLAGNNLIIPGQGEFG